MIVAMMQSNGPVYSTACEYLYPLLSRRATTSVTVLIDIGICLSEFMLLASKISKAADAYAEFDAALRPIPVI